MIFAQFAPADAEGVILAHTLRLPSRTLKKGRLLTKQDISDLIDADIHTVMGARLEKDDIDENQAAQLVASALAGPHLTVSKAIAGRCNLYAKQQGLALIDKERIDAINLWAGDITIATLAPHSEALMQQAVATIKITPFALPKQIVERCIELAGKDGAISLSPFQVHNAAVILTYTEGMKGRVLDATLAVTRARLEAMGSGIGFQQRCRHTVDAVSSVLKQALAGGHNPVLICGANITVDPGDVVPLAILDSGGDIEQFGMPVEPGNMLLLARHGQTTLINLPGCARSAKLNGLDWVLQRTLAKLPVSGRDICQMGVGGLIKDIHYTRRKRNLSARHSQQQSPQGAPTVAAIVLAAGRSQRMGSRNKLLAEVRGLPMVACVVDAALAAKVKSVVVVTGSRAQEVQQALSARSVVFCHNPDYKSGIASSLQCGLAAIDGQVDGAVILLGDMPLISAEQIDALIAEFDPNQERDIVAPVKDGKRGNPVLWSAHYFAAIQALSGDSGARSLLEEYAAQVWEVPSSDDAIFTDIDTLDELNQLDC